MFVRRTSNGKHDTHRQKKQHGTQRTRPGLYSHWSDYFDTTHHPDALLYDRYSHTHRRRNISSTEFTRMIHAHFLKHSAFSPQHRLPFGSAARSLLTALQVALQLFETFLAAHERDTARLKTFAGKRVLDLVWSARLLSERSGTGEVLDGDGQTDHGGINEEGESTATKEQVASVVKKLWKTLERTAGAKVSSDVGKGEAGMEEIMVRERVRGAERAFSELFSVAILKVEGMRALMVELGLLKVVLKSVVEKDGGGQTGDYPEAEWDQVSRRRAVLNTV